MSRPEIRLNSVMINVIDIEAQARFWSELLGVEIGLELGDHVWLRKQGGVGVALQRVDDPAAVPGRVHIDTLVDDLPAAQSHAESLGATLVAAHDLGGLAWVVMTDPEGNEFCLVRQSG
ncbi:MAG: VOC family protein [Acidimicrobiia bacterium]|nr:VOC family protein [Acidimicrobiia bacterium]